MLIKTIKNRTESDWFQLTKRLHRELIEEAPDSVLVHIEDIYPTAPERGTLIELNFDLFTTLVREFTLEELRQQKSDERHRDSTGVEGIDRTCCNLLTKSPEDIQLEAEQRDFLYEQLNKLTDLQRKRFLQYALQGKSSYQIARDEGVESSTVKESIQSAKKKLKKFLKIPH